MKYYYDPQNRLPYKKRLRNRCIAIAIFVAACALIGSCIFKSGEQAAQPKGFVVNGNDPTATSKEWIKDTLRVDSSIIDSLKEAHRAIKLKDTLTESAAKSLFFITGFDGGGAVFKDPVQNLRDKFTLLVFQIQFFQVCAFIPFIIHFIHYGNAIR